MTLEGELTLWHVSIYFLYTNYIRRVHKSSLTPVDNFWVIPLSSENTRLKDRPWYDIEDCCCTDDICWKLLDWEDENCCCMNCCCCCCCIICTCLLLLLLCSLCPDLKKHEKAFINFFGCIALKVWFLLALTFCCVFIFPFLAFLCQPPYANIVGSSLVSPSSFQKLQT